MRQHLKKGGAQCSGCLLERGFLMQEQAAESYQSRFYKLWGVAAQAVGAGDDITNKCLFVFFLEKDQKTRGGTF